MSDPTAKDIQNRYQRLAAKRGNWDNTCEEIARYMMPSRVGFQTKFEEGQQRSQYIYDSTATECVGVWADAGHFALANPFTAWMEIEYVDDELNDDDAASDALSSASEKMRVEMNQSNWSGQFNEGLIDDALFGTNCMSADKRIPQRGDYSDDWPGLVFAYEHMGQIVFSEDANKEVHTSIKRVEMTCEQAVQRFAEKVKDNEDKLRESIGRDIAECYKRKQWDRPFTFLHYVAPRHDAVYGDPMPREDRMPYASIWVAENTGKRVHIGGVMERNRIVCRLKERSMDRYGYGPGEQALPDVRTVNEAVRRDFAQWDLELDGPLVQEQNNIRSDVNAFPGGVTTVGNIDKIKMLHELKHGNMSDHMSRLTDRRESIRSIFHFYDLRLPKREDVGQMTAYEVAKRLQRIYQLMGPQLINIRDQLITPVMNRVFGLMARAGQFDAFPDHVPDNAQLKVRFTGPLAKAQLLEEVESTDSFVAEAVGLAQGVVEIDPKPALAILDRIDFDAVLKRKADVLGVPPDMLASDETVKEAQKVRDDAAKQQQVIADEQAAASALKDTSAAIGQGPMLEAVQNG